MLGVSVPSPDKVDIPGTIHLGKHRCVRAIGSALRDPAGLQLPFQGSTEMCSLTFSTPSGNLMKSVSKAEVDQELPEVMLQHNLNSLRKVAHPSFYRLDFRKSQRRVRIGRGDDPGTSTPPEIFHLVDCKPE